MVVGAGPAGTGAAMVAQEAGLKVIVVEARNRIGGRTWSLSDPQLSSTIVQAGAEFVHEPRALLAKLAARHGGRFRRILGDEYTYSHGFTWPSRYEILPSSGQMMHAIKERARLLMDQPDQQVTSILPTAKIFRPRHRWHGDIIMQKQIANDYGASTDQLGIKGLAEPCVSGYEGSNGRIKGGYARVMESLLSGTDVRLSNPVTNIDWTSDGVTVTTATEEIRARCAMVSLPLGVLREGSVTFRPALPEWKKQAIRALGVGSICKVLLRFKEKFWPDDMAYLRTLLSTQLWWQQDECKEPVLTALIGGPEAEYFQKLPEDHAVQLCIDHLERMFRVSLRGALLGKRIIRWNKMKYARMGYSHLPAGCPPSMRRQLAEDVDDALFFIGEATQSAKTATMTGAFDGGRRTMKYALKRCFGNQYLPPLRHNAC